jgi:hypothetical protein
MTTNLILSFSLSPNVKIFLQKLRTEVSKERIVNFSAMEEESVENYLSGICDARNNNWKKEIEKIVL